MAGLWTAVHGESRCPQPTYVEAVGVLQQLGCHPSVEVELLESAHVFDGLEEALARFAGSVAVGDDPDRLARLRHALTTRLEPLEDGRIATDHGPLPVATVWWEAGALRQP